jgi:hypothetical protein
VTHSEQTLQVMAEFIKAVLRLALKGRPQEGHVHADEEMGQHGIAGSSTLGGISNGGQHGTYVPRIPNEENLAQFRLLLGISSSPYLGYGDSGGSRPAANIGIYSRVVHSEQKSKDSFKVMSIVINACYFLQIVVAAALTAMGAAGTSNAAITAFGAINTIIAGFLTFLKGSGLPGRLKYYGNEWKKIREYIEQRERDFSREGCTLDVNEVVETIEKMYTNTKQEIEMNTPDSYTSVINPNLKAQDNQNKIGGIDISKLDQMASKIKGLDGIVHKLTTGIESRGRDVTHSIEDHEKQVMAAATGTSGGFLEKGLKGFRDLASTARHHEQQIQGEIRDYEKDIIKDVELQADRLSQAARQRISSALKGAEGSGRAVIDNTRDHISRDVGSLQDQVTSNFDVARSSAMGNIDAARANVDAARATVASNADTARADVLGDLSAARAGVDAAQIAARHEFGAARSGVSRRRR